MNKTEHVHVHKQDNPAIKTSFTRLIWEGMGSKKNGWVETSTAPAAAASNGKNDTETEARYRQLYDQGKGFTADGKHAEALAKYKEAQAVKDSPFLRGVINKAETAAKEAEQDANRAELVANAQAASNEGDFETAIDLLTTAQGIKETEDVAALLTEARTKEEESLTE